MQGGDRENDSPPRQNSWVKEDILKDNENSLPRIAIKKIVQNMHLHFFK